MLPPPPPPPPPLCPPPPPPVNFTSSDVDRINLALNIHYLQAEFFLHAAFGHGLDKVNAKLAKKGPPPVGGRKARLSTRMEHVAKELGLQSTGHIRAIHDKLDKQSICRPLLNISVGVWDSLISKALIHNHTEVDGGGSLHFDPYENDANFLIAAYVIPYIGLNTLIDSSNRVTGIQARKLVSGLMGVQAGQDAVIRTLLFEIMENKLRPYNVTVAKLTSLVSDLRHKLDHTRKADEGLSVHQNRGAEKQVNGNLISANDYSMAISRSPQQVLQVLYGTGDASVPGFFFPKGANGKIAGIFLKPRRPKL
ncbi:hypothetical protein SELMODRAFT_233386 [Selaginella moellendorffii]|uniref:Desiccation-related protein PCC13-62 n=1 Tax=Selaginella moellendorffii TaxID=88036 RepID=D8S8F4_SELML|nr:hypothetical protein SELMODRAFT_233386 [Selaginella moellendorffii]